MTRLDLAENLNQSVWNICVKFDTLNNIENYSVLEKTVLRENHVNEESKNLDLTI